MTYPTEARAAPTAVAPALASPSPALVLPVLAAHVPLALAMSASTTLATAHAVLTVGVVLWVLGAARTAGPYIVVAAYAAGCEVLWRETQASVPWELSKYVLILVFVVGILRFVGRLREALFPVTYLAVLAPACVVPLVSLGFPGGFEPVSFNLAGAVALAVGVLLLSQLAGPWDALVPTLWALIAPAVAVATLAARGVLSLTAQDFVGESNLAASGGFGPNQVSAVLGLAALFAIFIALRDRHLVLRVVSVALTLWFVGQALLTFSRGGVANLAIALLFAVPHLLARRESAARVLGLALTIGLVGGLLILPRIEDFTGGHLQNRFTDRSEADTRTYLAEQDLETFTDHPVLGVGVGQSEVERRDRRTVAAHTEYTRLLAEHGLFGLLAVLCLIAMFVQGYLRQPSLWGRAWTAALVAWTAAEMGHSAMRLALVPFVFTLAMFTFASHPDELDDRVA